MTGHVAAIDIPRDYEPYGQTLAELWEERDRIRLKLPLPQPDPRNLTYRVDIKTEQGMLELSGLSRLQLHILPPLESKNEWPNMMA